MATLQTILAFLVMIGVVITLHEWGHYRVARAFNIKIKRFSIGFGKPLWQSRRGPDQTEFVLAAIPLGGYVQMLDEREGPVEPHELHRAFNRQTVFKRFAVVAAGPLINIVLAVLLLWGILYWHGEQDYSTVISPPLTDSRAALAGLQEQDRIVSVGGVAVERWSQLHERLIDAMVSADSVELQILRGSTHRVLHLDVSGLRDRELGKDSFRTVGLVPYLPPVAAVLGVVLPDSPASRAGLLVGDRVMTVNGQPVADFAAFASVVRNHPGQSLQLEVQRGSAVLQLSVAPEVRPDEAGKGQGRIGAGPDAALVQQAFGAYRVSVEYGAVGALQESLRKSWEMTVLTLKVLGKMLFGEFSVKNLSGPITMADYAGETARVGLIAFLGYIAVVSLNIGLFNLFPIPLLDGGHLMYYTVEMIAGTPVSERVMALGQRVGIAALATLMGVAIYNDISRLLAAS